MTPRRGACPGLTRPMQTGDGLLARFAMTRPVLLDDFAAVCTAAQSHGNGIIEITSRGSIQVRGLTSNSAPALAAAVEALDIADPADGRVIASPLAGLDANEVLDVSALADALRDALIDSGLAVSLAPKVSVVIDGGGVLSLERVPADIRLRAESTRDGIVFHVSVAETPRDTVAPEHAVATVLELLQTIAAIGPTARARDLFVSQQLSVLSEISRLARLAPTLPPVGGEGRPRERSERGRDGGPISGAALAATPPTPNPSPPRFAREEGNRGSSAPIGIHALRDGTVALGVGLAFGHSDARTLQSLIEQAEHFGARAVRPSPGRTLLVIGVAPGQTNALTQAAQNLGFITQANDPRRRVIACAGAPVCAQAQIPARALAPAIADAARSLLERGATIHISGCAKGCAHPRDATVTIVGSDARCGIVRNGTARDTPREMIEPDELPAHLASLLEPAHG